MGENEGSGPAVNAQRWKWLILPLAVLPIAGVLNGPFLLSYDDYYAVVKNPLIAHGWSYFPELFSSARYPEWGHMQAGYISLAIDHALFGDFAGGYRLVTALIHAMSALLVYRIAARLCAPSNAGSLTPHIPLLAALIFTVHPTNVETLAWVIQRNNALAQLFGLLAISVCLGAWKKTDVPVNNSGPGALRWIATLLLLALALCSKIAATGLVFAFAGLELFYFRDSLARRLLRVGLLLPLFAAGAAMNYFAHQQQLVPPVGGESLAARLAGTLHLHGRAWGLALFPSNLSAFYHVTQQITALDGAIAAAVLVPCAVLALYRWLGLPLARAALLLLWAVGAFAPAMNPFFGISFALQDRYIYLALPPICILLAEVFMTLAQRLAQSSVPAAAPQPPRSPRAGWVLGYAFVAVFGLLAAMRSMAWRHESILFEDAAAKQPASAFGHAYLATHIYDALNEVRDASTHAQLAQQALEEYAQAEKCDDYERLVFPLEITLDHASLLLQQNRRDEARPLFQQVWSTRPERATEKGVKARAATFLAADALEKKDYSQALQLIAKALEVSPGNASLLLLRLQGWSESGRNEEAQAEGKRLSTDPQLKPRVEEILKRQ